MFIKDNSKLALSLISFTKKDKLFFLKKNNKTYSKTKKESI